MSENDTENDDIELFELDEDVKNAWPNNSAGDEPEDSDEPQEKRVES